MENTNRFLEKVLQMDFTYDNRMLMSFAKDYYHFDRDVRDYVDKWFAWSTSRSAVSGGYNKSETSYDKLCQLIANKQFEEEILKIVLHKAADLADLRFNDPYRDYICESRNLSGRRADFYCHKYGHIDLKMCSVNKWPSSGCFNAIFNPMFFHGCRYIMVAAEDKRIAVIIDAETLETVEVLFDIRLKGEKKYDLF